MSEDRRRARRGTWIRIAVLGAWAAFGMVWSVIDRVPIDGPREHAERYEPPPPIRHLIDINSATERELTLLAGIGPAIARRIVEDRASVGPFRSVDDLQRVKGIGPRTVDRIRADVVAGTPDDREPEG